MRLVAQWVVLCYACYESRVPAPARPSNPELGSPGSLQASVRSLLLPASASQTERRVLQLFPDHTRLKLIVQWVVLCYPCYESWVPAPARPSNPELGSPGSLQASVRSLLLPASAQKKVPGSRRPRLSIRLGSAIRWNRSYSSRFLTSLSSPPRFGTKKSAEAGSRTPTAVTPLGPEPSASASSATSALHQTSKGTGRIPLLCALLSNVA